MSSETDCEMPPLTSDRVPGKLCLQDKEKIAEVYNLIRNRVAPRASAPNCSRLRVVDTLANRFKFVVTNPRNVSLAVLRAARLKLACSRDMLLDLEGNKFVVDCWRTNKQEQRGAKRGRPPPPIDKLPGKIRRELEEAAAEGDGDEDMTFLRGMVLWVLNHDDFCEFDFSAAREDSYEGGAVYKLVLGGFEPVSDVFVREMERHWGAFLRDAVFEFSSQSVVLYAAK